MTTRHEPDLKKQSPRADLRKLKPEYVKNGHEDVLHFTLAMHLPRDVAAYGREAPNCFNERRYLATIILSSAAIEIILNKDSRMRAAGRDWQNLNMKQLREGDLKGLPLKALLGPGESLRDKSIEFIDLRNRLAHGNLQGIVGFEHTGTPDYSEDARETALSHMKKAEAFVMEWYNTSPDVQDRRIVDHTWPK
jgi:hypothetical protein